MLTGGVLAVLANTPPNLVQGCQNMYSICGDQVTTHMDAVVLNPFTNAPDP